MTRLPASMAIARFGLGIRPGDLHAVGDVRGALLAELMVPDTLALGGQSLRDGRALYAQVRQMQRLRQAAKDGDDPVYDEARRAFADLQRDEAAVRIEQIKAAPTGIGERLVAFWANHFAVEAGANQLVRGLAGAFEREAIRPHVLGRFADMLATATRHPAMLIYLNNAVSVGPASRQGQRQGKGLNENHARELMELHTLGVDGGYSQDDVTSLAKVLTGWSIGNRENEGDSYGAFLFRQQAHEPGPQTVLGIAYPQPDMEQGDAALVALASHPSTARHLALKLARHFVADRPDAALVDLLARTFLDTDGDLLDVSRALIESDLAWTQERSKLRSPQEFVWAATRALDLPIKPQQAVRLLGDLGQPLWDPPSPAGFKDDVATWLAPDAMTNRLAAAELMAADAEGPDDPRELAALIFGEAVSAQTLETIARAESRIQGIALLLMSPEFQRR